MSTNAQIRRRIFIDREIREATQRMNKAANLGSPGEYDPTPLPNCRSLALKWSHEENIYDKKRVSPRTIQRDLDWLQDEQHAPLAYDSNRRGYYYTEEAFVLPAISITESDLFAICIAEKALVQYVNTPLHKKLTNVFDKIADYLPKNVSIHSSWVDNRMSFFDTPARNVDPALWDKASKALQQSRRLNILYQSPGSPKSMARRIDPYHMAYYKGDWYIIAHCHLRNDIRRFAVSRIRSAEILDTRFTIPPDFNPEKTFRNRFGIMMSDKTYKVRVRYSPQAAPVAAEREWQKGQKLEWKKDGSLVITSETSHLTELASWIMSWGKEAKVLEPKELAQRIAAQHKAAAALYR